MNTNAVSRIAFFVAAGMCSFTQAATYTDRANFLADAGNVDIETFESSPIVGTTNSGAVESIAFDDFTVSSTPVATKVINADAYYGVFNTTPEGENYLYIDTDEGYVGSTATFVFDSPKTSIGFDYTGFNESGSTFDLSINGDTYSLAMNPNDPTSAFWGYTSEQSFSSFSFTTSSDSGYSFDQVTYSEIPVPAAIWLFVSGLAGLTGAGIGKRRST